MAIPYRKRKRKILGPDHQQHEAWVMEQFSYEPVKFESFVKECIMSQGVSGAQVKVQFYPHKDFQDVLSQMTFVDMDTLNEKPEEEGDAVHSQRGA